MVLHLRPHGIEVHEPRLEQRLRHRLKRLVHPTVQLDLVVERAEDVGDGALLGIMGGTSYSTIRWLCIEGFVPNLSTELAEE